MKKLIIAAALLASPALYAQERTATLHISGMTCGTCPITVRHRALNMTGVHAASVDLATASATVQYEDSQQSPQAIAQAITQLGYPATVIGNK